MEWLLIAATCLIVYFLFSKGWFWKIILWIFGFIGLQQFLSDHILFLQNNVIWLGSMDSKFGVTWATVISWIVVSVALKIFTDKARQLDDD